MIRPDSGPPLEVDAGVQAGALAAFYGTAPGVSAPAHCVIRVTGAPGTGPDGGTPYSVVAACPTFEGMLAAARLLR